jgi:putative ubiquitin-RnfH superfamily antitoxin RatB of RatAB toxin-antitoxin module
VTRAAITVEVVYALPERQTLIALAVAPGTTAGEAVTLSGVVTVHPELGEREPSIGIFGRVVGRDHVLDDGDRIEIYRPLVADPKTSRNERVARKRQGRENVRNMRAGARTKKASRAGAPGRCLC